MNLTLTLFLLSFSCVLYGTGIPSLPLDLVEAEHVDFDEKVVHLIGHVKVAHEIGLLQCNEATLILQQDKQSDNHSSVGEILLKGNVFVQLTDESTVTADEGEIDCRALEGTFFCHPPNKVVYQGFTDEKHSKIPVRASGRALRANITKTSDGYTLTSLRGEGAVNIEYIRPTEPKPSEESPIPETEEEPSL